jgi:GT2 family glycosyltransferase
MSASRLNASIVAIVPTRNRPRHLINALSSIAHQSRQPDLLIVVKECEYDHEAVVRVASTLSKTALVILPNGRASNLSGAVNTALHHLLRTNLAPRTTYVALLDDDDTWEPEYLERCASMVETQDLDWVVSGIYRHETEDGAAHQLSIPESIEVSNFLVTNPHVQGSNLFVRLSTFLEAGCFDENLQSTTDRDVSIRLLNLGGTKVGFLREYLVHYMALGHDRLSIPGSPSKRQGLIAFYEKYGPTMSEEQRTGFLHRATMMFGCAFEDFQQGDCQ